MGATICKYFQKFKTLIKKCFNCNTNFENEINPPYKLKQNEDEIIKSKNTNKIKAERKISDYVEENYLPKNSNKTKNQNSQVDIEEFKKKCSDNSELKSDKKSIILSNKNLIIKSENEPESQNNNTNENTNNENFTPKSPI